MTTLQLPAQLDNLSLRKDGSVLLKFETRELSAQEMMMVLGFRNTEGWLLFSQNSEMKAPEGNAHLDTKSPSERLRDVLFVLYKQEGETTTFETFYNEKMEKLINMIKSKLN